MAIPVNLSKYTNFQFGPIDNVTKFSSNRIFRNSFLNNNFQFDKDSAFNDYFFISSRKKKQKIIENNGEIQ